ncbi:MAG: hypothetical protein JRN26_05565 [Nitrososphaerota archaeon]|jgi:hypothetical protein|nr:hypothetical protein [Nitrososphaerota archaeon]MDG6927193.1 hypothetical protein [Nitrososphaerota archaeon]MDG6930819.1 hypothetical protein [Nitrososphaerota archaeon]MDG6932263.1 hypothetical protein [Nitrososphaerota archaeon]MDG6936332.1 hypothetical protein [Nitrososphaerota archaeon]
MNYQELIKTAMPMNLAFIEGKVIVKVPGGTLPEGGEVDWETQEYSLMIGKDLYELIAIKINGNPLIFRLDSINDMAKIELLAYYAVDDPNIDVVMLLSEDFEHGLKIRVNLEGLATWYAMHLLEEARP